jgi:hypothetical protein
VSADPPVMMSPVQLLLLVEFQNGLDERRGGTSLCLVLFLESPIVDNVPHNQLLDPCPDPARPPSKLQAVLLLRP